MPACSGGTRKQHAEHGVLCRYQWFGVALRNLDWWGAFSYTVGVGLYWIAALSTMINDCPNTTLDPIVYVRHLICLPHACVHEDAHFTHWSDAATLHGALMLRVLCHKHSAICQCT